MYHPAAGKMRAWMKAAEWQLTLSRRAVTGAAPIVPKGQPVEVFILCVFELAPSKHRKRIPVPRAWCVNQNSGDWDNLAKPVCDAATDVLWHDDCQVARAFVETVVGAQGEAPRLEILVRPLLASPESTLFHRTLVEARQSGSLPPPKESEETEHEGNRRGRGLPF